MREVPEELARSAWDQSEIARSKRSSKDGRVAKLRLPTNSTTGLAFRWLKQVEDGTGA